MKDQELRERGEWQIRESTIQCSINVMEAGQPMAEDTFLPRVRYVKVVNGNSMKTLALIEGICDKQIGMLIQAAFKLSAPVCVLRDCKTNINIPLSILCGASSQFEECRFSLVAPAFSAAQPLRSDICAFGGESKRGYDKNERGNNDLEEDLVEGGRGMEGFVATVRNCHSRRPPRSANVPTTHRSRSQPLRVINQRKKRINAPMHLWNSDDSSHIGNDIPRTAIKNSEESSSTNDTFDYSTRGGRVLRHSRQSKRQGVMENIWTKGIKHNSHRHQSRSPVLKLHPREIDRILEVRQTTLLSKLTASQVRKLYHQCKDKEGLITKKALEKRVQCFIPGQGLAHYTHVQRTINEIMGTFDLHGNGVIDAKEFLVGMSVLCNGTLEEKIMQLFKGLDEDGDGFINFYEMEEYIQLFFKTAFMLTQSSLKEGLSPFVLGHETAIACFMEADKNRDGKMSFQEFRTWYKSKQSKPGTILLFFEHA